MDKNKTFFPTKIYCWNHADQCYCLEREKNLLPLNMSLWHEHYFELKTIKTQQIQEKSFASPFNYLN